MCLQVKINTFNCKIASLGSLYESWGHSAQATAEQWSNDNSGVNTLQCKMNLELWQRCMLHNNISPINADFLSTERIPEI